MIGRLTGILLEKNPPQILLDVNGVGYEVEVPMSTFYNLPNTNERVSLCTHLAIREDAHVLYGFGSEDERATFRQLLKISGIGARTALAVLSGLSVAELAQAVTLQETGRLTKIPGIGKKTAERLLLELKDKLAKALPGVSLARSLSPEHSTQADIVNALLALGYNEKEAQLALKQLPAEIGVSDGIRAALKLLSQGLTIANGSGLNRGCYDTGTHFTASLCCNISTARGIRAFPCALRQHEGQHSYRQRRSLSALRHSWF